MVGAGGAHRSQLGQRLAADEFEHRRAVVEMPDPAGDAVVAASCHQPPDHRHQPRSDGTTCLGFQRGGFAATERGTATGPLGQPLGRPVDGRDGGVVALLLGLPPGEQPVRLQHQAIRLGVPVDEPLQPDAELETGPAPRHPADAGAEDLPGQGLAIGRGRDGDDRIGMDMVDMRMPDQPVQRRVDAGRARVEVEGQMRIQRDHLVLMVGTAIERLGGQQLVHIQGREAVEPDAAEIAARALHPEHRHRRPGQRIGHRQLGRGVAATVVGDTLVGAEQVGAIQQQRLGRQAGGVRLVPAVLQQFGIGVGTVHGWSPGRRPRHRRPLGDPGTGCRIDQDRS